MLLDSCQVSAIVRQGGILNWPYEFLELGNTLSKWIGKHGTDLNDLLFAADCMAIPACCFEVKYDELHKCIFSDIGDLIGPFEKFGIPCDRFIKFIMIQAVMIVVKQLKALTHDVALLINNKRLSYVIGSHVPYTHI